MGDPKHHRMEIIYQRHRGQAEVHEMITNSDADIFVIDAARGWGKSIYTTADLVIPKLFSKPYTQIQWIAPSYKICKAPIDDVWNGVDDVTGKRFIPNRTEDGLKLWEFYKSDMEIRAYNKSTLYMRSADNPDSILAKGYDLIVIDEAALIPEDVFMRQILPTARKAGCKIIIISTPRGKNWFYNFFQAGKDRSRPEYASIRQPWWKRPDYPDLLKRLMKDVPAHIRRAEFDAEFVGDGGEVFRNLQRVFMGPEVSFESNQQEWLARLDRDTLNNDLWTVGVDLAKSQDYTCITVVGQQSKKMAYYLRRNQEDYRLVIDRIKRVAAYFNDADVIYDATGVGSGVGDFLNKDINAFPYKFSNESKMQLINRLIVGCETGEMKMPNILTMKSEFEAFTYELTKTGKMKYNAPPGKHDDTVIAAALAYWFSKENEGTTDSHEVDNFLDVVADSMRPKTEYEEFIEED